MNDTNVKRTGEAYTFWFDFAPGLVDLGDFLTGSPTVTAFPQGLTLGTPFKGSDPAAPRLIGIRISGGNDGITYTLEASCATNDGNEVAVVDYLKVDDSPLVPPVFMQKDNLYAFFFDFKNHSSIQRLDSLSGVPTVTSSPGGLTLGAAGIRGTQVVFQVEPPGYEGNFTLECTCGTTRGDTVQSAGALYVHD